MSQGDWSKPVHPRQVFLGLSLPRASEIANELVASCWDRLDERLEDRGHGRLSVALAQGFPDRSPETVRKLTDTVVRAASGLAVNRRRGTKLKSLLDLPRVLPLDLRGALLLHLTESPHSRVAAMLIRDTQDEQRLIQGVSGTRHAVSDDEAGDILLRSERCDRVMVERVAMLEIASLAGSSTGCGFDRFASWW